MRYILETSKLVKTYKMGRNDYHALKGVDLKVRTGEFVSVMGQSGSGKSTLLNLVSGLDNPTSGSVMLDGMKISQLNDAERTLMRRQKIGFIFQFFNLIPVLNVLENVTLPLMISDKKTRESEAKAKELLKLVGLADKLTAYPAELSGGQQQRVAIARALVTQPALILADEPTGSLDSKNSRDVMMLLKDCQSRMKQTIVTVTHDAEVASYSERVLFMKDGELFDELFLDPDVPRSRRIREITSRIEVMTYGA
ncbi:ABC transporter ATP-binding protein [Lihuaxuella thermophila]|uniref:Putative ABC transport system ATP-binding protein n=1 Tax=Lihuaxuella thermophila TaxID=1173111 RepID=A0A1H8G6F1_9BACL|nr:ABC transporter ATP-binding protein [Lihuaxuella thermophila]SEN39334.1 putative ABC transport system ATP-binding protein [Lihuaxuella thermophila]